MDENKTDFFYLEIHFLVSTLTTSLLAMTVSSRSLANVPMQRITVLFVHEAPLPIGSLDIPSIGGAAVKTFIPENRQQIFKKFMGSQGNGSGGPT